MISIPNRPATSASAAGSGGDVGGTVSSGAGSPAAATKSAVEGRRAVEQVPGLVLVLVNVARRRVSTRHRLVEKGKGTFGLPARSLGNHERTDEPERCALPRTQHICAALRSHRSLPCGPRLAVLAS